jgi:hypothetical protein
MEPVERQHDAGPLCTPVVRLPHFAGRSERFVAEAVAQF